MHTEWSWDAVAGSMERTCARAPARDRRLQHRATEFEQHITERSRYSAAKLSLRPPRGRLLRRPPRGHLVAERLARPVSRHARPTANSSAGRFLIGLSYFLNWPVIIASYPGAV